MTWYNNNTLKFSTIWPGAIPRASSRHHLFCSCSMHLAALVAPRSLVTTRPLFPNLRSVLLLIISIYVSCVYVHMISSECGGQKMALHPLSWTYRWLCFSQQGFWEQNRYPLWEQYALKHKVISPAPLGIFKHALFAAKVHLSDLLFCHNSYLKFGEMQPAASNFWNFFSGISVLSIYFSDCLYFVSLCIFILLYC